MRNFLETLPDPFRYSTARALMRSAWTQTRRIRVFFILRDRKSR